MGNEIVISVVERVKEILKVNDNSPLDLLQLLRHYRNNFHPRAGLLTVLFLSVLLLYHCGRKLRYNRAEIVKQWIRSLRRRSQRHKMYWSYLASKDWFKLPYLYISISQIVVSITNCCLCEATHLKSQ